MEATLVTVCAWCPPLRWGQEPGVTYSHGVCDPCAERMLADRAWSGHRVAVEEEPVLLRCYGCRDPLTRKSRTVCPMCVRPSCRRCLRYGGCRHCLVDAATEKPVAMHSDLMEVFA